MRRLPDDRWHVLEDRFKYIDGNYCHGDDPLGNRQEQSLAKLTHEKGWSILSWWDRSIDTRLSSNSNIVAKGTFTGEEMLALALERFPRVMHRQPTVRVV